MKNFLYLISFFIIANASAINNVLVIDSSVSGELSVTKKLTSELAKKVSEKYPNAKIIKRDLVKDPVPSITPDVVAAFFTPLDKQDNKIKKTLELSNLLTDELLEADLVIVGAPMYNFGISSNLKAWIDNVVRAGKTFSYTDKGANGLLSKETKVVIITASGGVYDSSSKYADYVTPYLKQIFSFIGVSKIKLINAEGMAKDEKYRNSSIASASHEIDKIIEII